MAELKDKKINGESIGKNYNLIDVEYDFSKDGGAIGVYEALEADSNCVVELEHVMASIELDSAADGGLISIGKTNEFYDGEAEASFAANAPLVPNKKIYLAKGQIINMEIAGEALTAGKMKMQFKLIKA